MVLNRARIFIAEDEAAILRMVRNVLSRMEDVEIVGASQNGSDACDKIAALQPDIVVTDIVMPMMTGLELMRQAQTASPATRFILLTGYERFEFAREALQLQAADYLLKPVDVDQLRKTVREVWDGMGRERRADLLRRIREAYLSEGRSGFQNAPYRLRYISAWRGHYTAFDEGDVFSFRELDERMASRLPEDFLAFGGIAGRERVYGVLVPDGAVWEPRSLADIPGRDGEPLTLTVSRMIECDQNLSGAIAEIHQTLLARQRFAQSTLLIAGEAEETDFWESRWLHERCRELCPGMAPERLRTLAERIVSGWHNAFCAQIRTDLKFMLSYARQFTVAERNMPYLSELVERLIGSESEARLADELAAALADELGSANETGERESGERELAQRMKTYLDTAFCEEINRDRLSELFGYNKNYLTSAFSHSFGMAPGQYVVKKRIQYAKALLVAEPGAKMKSIAQRVGYEDPLYFSRVFKAQTGVSPSEYIHEQSGSSRLPRE